MKKQLRIFSVLFLLLGGVYFTQSVDIHQLCHHDYQTNSGEGDVGPPHRG